MLEALYNQYISLNFNLIFINSKKQPIKARTIGECEAFNPTAKYGAVTNKGIVIIDVDIKNGDGRQSFKKLENDLGVKLLPTVKTRSGGLHYYITSQLAVKQVQKEYPHIDFISYKLDENVHTTHVVAGGQTVGGKYEVLGDKLHLNKVDIDQKLSECLELQVLGSKKSSSIEMIPFDGDMDFDGIEADEIIDVDHIKHSYSLEQVEQLLTWCSNEDYESWMKGCAILKRLSNDSNEAKYFRLFDSWSSTYEGYKPDEVRKKWDNIGSYGGNEASLGSFINEALRAKTTYLIDRLERASNEKELKASLYNAKEFPFITKKELQDEISVSLKKESKRLGIEIDKRTAEKRTKAGVEESWEDIEAKILDLMAKGESLLEWTKDLVYVVGRGSNKYKNREGYFDSVSIASYYYRELQALNYSKQAYDYIRYFRVGDSEIGIHEIMKYNLIKPVQREVYQPTSKDFIIKDHLGEVCMNSFRPASVPKSTQLQAKHLEVINKVVAHYERLYEKSDVEVLFDYLAFIAQNFGIKINWAILLQGSHGVGKTLLAEIMQNHVLGMANTGIVSPQDIENTFTSWADGGVLKIIEELRLSHESRFKTLNKLKPYISNPIVTIENKGETIKNVRNYASYLILTNYRDAIPKGGADEDTRRYFRIYSKIRSDEEFQKLLDSLGFSSTHEYFEPLLKVRHDPEFGGAFREWLLQRDISKFNPSSKFPYVELHEEEAEQIEVSKDANVEALKYFIDDNFKDIRVISTTELTAKLKGSIGSAWDDQLPTRFQLHKYLTTLGYTKLNTRVSITIDKKQTRHIVFIKNIAEVDARESLRARLVREDEMIAEDWG